MCGVFGFAGTNRDIEASVGKALRSLEYRGYDSWGVSWIADGKMTTQKQVGRLQPGFLPTELASAAIGHTRWATHGGVSNANAHPHCGCSGQFSVVHNGIVENSECLRKELAPNHLFHSSTDSEVIPHLLEEAIAHGLTVANAVVDAFLRLDGHNAIVVLDVQSNVIYAISSGSPLLIAESELGSFIASDAIAFHRQASQMTPLPERTLARLDRGGVKVRDCCDEGWTRPEMFPVVHRDVEELGGFAHHTLREISQQPAVICKLLDDADVTRDLALAMHDAQTIVFTGCGSAFFAARFGVSWLSSLVGKAAIAIPSSEFGECLPFVNKDTLVIAMTQSGETADVVDAIALAQQAGARVHALVNVPYSTVARMVDQSYPLHAGVEQSVLATKSFMAMMVRLLLAISETIDAKNEVFRQIRDSAVAFHQVTTDPCFNEQITLIAERVAACDHVFLIGRGAGFAAAQETALKLKEGSYIHAEALAAGELKHGAIALIEDGTPCLIFGSRTGSPGQLASTSQELRSRGAYTIGIGVSGSTEYSETLDVVAFGPSLEILQILVGQHIAYRAALIRGVNPDRPRNLAKSVTVR